MAVKVREGHSGNTNLAPKYWLTGDLGDEWGTNKKGEWVVVSFDPSTKKEQRDALAPMILKTYGLEWGELKVQEAPIEINHSWDIVNASLGGGQMASMKLKRERGADGKGVVLKNVSISERGTMTASKCIALSITAPMCKDMNSPTPTGTLF